MKKRSRFHGVYWKNKNRRWCVEVYHNKKFRYIGSYGSEIDAAIGLCLYVRSNNIISLHNKMSENERMLGVESVSNLDIFERITLFWKKLCE